MKTSPRQILARSFLPVFAAIILVVGIAYAVWTEPTAAPPGNNTDAPVNVGTLAQLKNGVLGVLGLMVYNDYDQNGIDVTGRVLTAQNAYGAAAWAAGGGGMCFVYYCNRLDNNNSGLFQVHNTCTNHGGAQGYCPSGFQQKYDMGSWGYCYISEHAAGTVLAISRPPGGGCNDGGLWYGIIWPAVDLGEAYVCCQ